MHFRWWQKRTFDDRCRWCKNQVLQPMDARWFEYPLLAIGIRPYYCPHCFTRFYTSNFVWLAVSTVIFMACIELALAMTLPRPWATFAFLALPPTVCGAMGYALGRNTGLVIAVAIAVVLAGLTNPG